MDNVKVGDTIKIIKMEGEPQYTNREGIVTHIDDIGQIHGTWGGCAIIPDVDVYKIIHPETNITLRKTNNLLKKPPSY